MFFIDEDNDNYINMGEWDPPTADSTMVIDYTWQAFPIYHALRALADALHRKIHATDGDCGDLIW